MRVPSHALRVLAFPLGLAFIIAVPHRAGADATSCKRVITKGAAKYVQSRAKAIQRCHDGRMRGQLPAGTNCDADSTTVAMVASARARFTKAVGGACGGADG